MATFQAAYTVTIGDINYGGHMGNERALVVFQDARIRFLSHLGCSEIDIGENRGIIMVDASIRYLHEVFLHDELEIEMTVSQLKEKKFVLSSSIRRRADKQAVLRCEASFLAFDYGVRKVAPLPKAFYRKMAEYFQDKK